jgi:hypothetical protein
MSNKLGSKLANSVRKAQDKQPAEEAVVETDVAAAPAAVVEEKAKVKPAAKKAAVKKQETEEETVSPKFSSNRTWPD